MGQVLVNPSTINVSPWFSSGTGAAATSATTFQTSASTSASLAQSITVTPGTTYTATVTVRGASATGYCTLAIYPTNYSTSYGSQTISLTTSNQVLSFSSAIPAGVTAAVFEMDFDSTAGIVVTITGASYSNGQSLTRIFTDSITLVSTLGRLIGKKASDSLTPNDTLQSTRARLVALLDSLTLADTLQSTRTRLLMLLDALNPLDTIIRSSARILIDVGTLTEAIGRTLTRSMVDGFTLADTLESARVRLLSFFDSFALADSTRRLTTRVAADTLAIVDANTAKSLNRAPLTDSLPLADLMAASRVRLLALFDALTLTERLNRFISTIRADGLALADVVLKSLSAQIAPSLGTIQIFRVKAQTRRWTIAATRRTWTVSIAIRKWVITERNLMISTSKDPLSAEDFQLDWAAELGTADTIASSAWTVAAGLSAANSGSITGKTTQIRLTGGTVGRTYLVTNLVTLASGQTKARSLTITIERL